MVKMKYLIYSINFQNWTVLLMDMKQSVIRSAIMKTVIANLHPKMTRVWKS